ncbi:MAG: hypothetical protein WCA30_08080 [Dermatophilaceae bacterium]
MSFVNTPLTDVTVSVDSQIDGGTASTISCVDANAELVAENTTNDPGDVELTINDLSPPRRRTRWSARSSSIPDRLSIR